MLNYIDSRQLIEDHGSCRPACPSKGWKTGVDQLSGLPNGKPLLMKVESNTVAVAAPAVATAASTDSGAKCTAIQDVDYGRGTKWLSKPCGGHGSIAANLACCCEFCAKQQGCVAGVIFQKTCYLKNSTQVKSPAWGAGSTASWVAGTTPVEPPMPPLGGCNSNLQMETHGCDRS